MTTMKAFSGMAPIERKSLSETVYERILAEILSGGLAPGDPLPAERRLVERFGVNRQALREALKRLEQAGLVVIHQGGQTRVQDWRACGGLELLPFLLEGASGLNVTVARDVMDMRLAIGPDIARLCAMRAGAEVATSLDRVVEEMRGIGDDLVRLQELSMRFWGLLTDGSGNIAYRLAYNALTAAYGEFLEPMRTLLAEELTDADSYAAIATAVEESRPGRAQWAARQLMEKGHRSVMRALAMVSENGSGEGVS